MSMTADAPPFHRLIQLPDVLIVRPLEEAVVIEIGRPGPRGSFELAAAFSLDPAEARAVIDALLAARRLVRCRIKNRRERTARQQPPGPPAGLGEQP